MDVGPVRKLVREVLPEIAAFRHELHGIPEIAGEEFKTSALLRRELGRLELEILPPFLDTDVVALLRTGRPGRNVALRADIDGLPIEERTGKEYASRHPGMMHACGHDGHMAMLFGAAKVLCRLRPELCGTVRFVFQPGEEVRALGKQLVAAGALEEPKADLVAALHGWPELPVGVIFSRPGAMMAAAAHFTIRLRGRGGHGSMPELAVDPLFAGCRIVTALREMLASCFPPPETVVLSVCRFESGISSNVIPDTALLAGTTRTLSAAAAAAFESEIRKVVDKVCAAAGVSYELDYEQNYQATVNDPAAFRLAEQVTEKYLGKGCFRLLERPSMGAEDFSFYLEKYPGVLVWIGVGETCARLHNPAYDFNDEALESGILYFAGLALEATR